MKVGAHCASAPVVKATDVKPKVDSKKVRLNIPIRH